MGRWRRGWLQRAWWGLPALAVLPWLAYPPLEWHAAGWLGLVPLLLLLRHAPVNSRGEVLTWLGLGWGYGMVFYALHYHWVARALLELAGVSVGHFTAFALVGLALLGVFFALSILGSRWLWLRWGILPCYGFPVLYTCQELVLGTLPWEGLPWGQLGGSQAASVGAHWLAPLAGGSALSLLMLLINGGWAGLLGCWVLRRQWAPGALLVLTVLTALFASPWPGALPPARESFFALLVPSDFLPGQGNAALRLRDFLARTLSALTTTAKKSPAELVLWPESAVKGGVETGPELVWLFHFARLQEVDLLFGSDSRRQGRNYNSAYLVQGGEFDFIRYDKRELVPFGEYVPRGLRWWFGRKLTAGAQDYHPGQGPPLLQWRSRNLGVAICSESILAHHMRRSVRLGAELLVVLANDQWLTPAARRQHLRLTALRGLETGREVLFVSNGGWSAHLAAGRVLGEVRASGSPLHVQVGLRDGQTPWVRWGHGPLWLLLGICSAVAVLTRRSKGLPPGGIP